MPTDIPAAQIQRARLAIYVEKAAKSGNIEILQVASDWSEDDTGTAPSTVNGAAATPALLPVSRSKSFVFFDVTDLVRSWVSGSVENHGLAIVSDDGKFIFGAKEGPGTGYPATIEITDNPVLPLFSNADPSSGLILGTAIAPGTIQTTQLGLGSVNAGILATSAVGSTAIADGSITTSKLADSAVTGAKIGAFTVGGGNLTDGAVGADALLDGSVITSKLADGSVTNAKLGAAAVTATNVQPGSLTGDALQDGSVLFGKIGLQYAVFWDAKAPNVDGGAATLNAWNQRTLNSENNHSGGAIVRNGNTITLQPGTYYIHGSCPANQVYNHQAVIRQVNADNSFVVVLDGTSEYNLPDFGLGGFSNRSSLEGYLTVTNGPQNYQLWHYVNSGRVQSINFGISNQNGDESGGINAEPSIYTVINIIKLN